MIQYAFFFFFCTLADTSEGIFRGIEYTTEQMELSRISTKNAREFIGPPLRDSFVKFCNLSGEVADEAVRIFRDYYGTKGKYECAVYPGTYDALKMLGEQGIRMYVATAKPTELAKDVLHYLGISELFEDIAGSETEKGRVRKCDVIGYLLNRYNITQLSEVVMVGDREQDIVSAIECGIRAIGVSFGFGSASELSSAEVILDSMKRVAQYITSDRQG